MGRDDHERISMDNHERLIRLEARFENLEEKQDIMDKKVSEMYDIFIQGKGVKWVLWGIWGVLAMILVKVGLPFSWGSK